MRLLLTCLVFISCYTVHAQSGIILSGGGGFGITRNNLEYGTGNTYLAGISASIKRRQVLTLGIGARFWNAQYKYTSPLFDDVKRPVGTVALDGSANIITVPLQAGLEHTYRNIHFAATGLIGMSFYNNPRVRFDDNRLATRYNAGSFNPGTDGSYFTAGAEFSIGYEITEMIGIDLRYSYLTFLSALNNKDMPYLEPAKEEKPMLNAIGLYLNVRL